MLLSRSYFFRNILQRFATFCDILLLGDITLNVMDFCRNFFQMGILVFYKGGGSKIQKINSKIAKKVIKPLKRPLNCTFWKDRGTCTHVTTHFVRLCVCNNYLPRLTKLTFAEKCAYFCA